MSVSSSAFSVAENSITFASFFVLPEQTFPLEQNIMHIKQLNANVMFSYVAPSICIWKG